MKTMQRVILYRSSYLAVLLSFLVTACTSQQLQHHVDATWDAGMKVYAPNVGFLKVLIAAPDEGMFYDGPPLYEQRYESYEVFTHEGKKVKTIPARYDEPATTMLAPGRYVIIAKVQSKRFIKFGVMIEPGKTTIVEDIAQDLTNHP